MMDATTNIISVFIMFPLLCYLIVFILCKQITKRHRFSAHIAIDTSTIFFIISVHFILQSIWNKSFLGYIIIFMLIIGCLMVFLHWKIKEEINYKRLFKSFWRVNFLFFFCLYSILMIYGLIHYVIKAINPT